MLLQASVLGITVDCAVVYLLMHHKTALNCVNANVNLTVDLIWMLDVETIVRSKRSQDFDRDFSFKKILLDVHEGAIPCRVIKRAVAIN